MDFFTGALFSLSIAPAGVAALYRRTKTDPFYQPFLLLTVVGLVNELASLLLIYNGYSNYFNYNAYALFEALVIGWQFARAGLFVRVRWLYGLLQAVVSVWWLIELLWRPMYSFSSYFIISHSLFIVLMSISYLNRMIFEESGPLWRHPMFLICIGFIVYFTYAALIEICLVFGLGSSKFFRLRVYSLLVYINALVNFIYFAAILWMPTKRRYILPSGT